MYFIIYVLAVYSKTKYLFLENYVNVSRYRAVRCEKEIRHLWFTFIVHYLCLQ